MGYLGVPPQSGFITTAKQRVTGSTNNYVDLDHSIGDLSSVIVWVNSVKQDSTNLTLTTSTRITLGDTLTASDVVEIAYLGKAVATQTPDTGTVTNDMLAGSIANSKLASPFNPDQAQTFNESGAAVDFRVESDGNENAFFVDGSANRVGFGIAAPETEMHIKSTSGECELRLTAASTSDARLRFGDTDDTDKGYIGYSRHTGIMTFSTDNTGGADMQILAASAVKCNSRLIIDNEQSSSYKLNIEGGFSNEAGILINDKDNAADGTAFIFTRNSANTTLGRIIRNGSNDSVLYQTSSDYRMKENVEDLTGGIESVKLLSPKKFNWKSNPEGDKVSGFIAHELQEVVPESVSGTKDALMKDSDGNIKLDKDGNQVIDAQGVDASKLVPLLTSALQEAITKIETLETEMTALKARVKTLEEA